MSTPTAPAAPKVTATALDALLAQRGGIVVWDLRDGASRVYAREELAGTEAEDRDLIPVLEYAEVATRAQHEAPSTIARSVTAIFANLAARGLL